MTIKQSQPSEHAAAAPNGATVTPLPRSDATLQRQFDELLDRYNAQAATAAQAHDELTQAHREAGRLIELLAEAHTRLADTTATADDRTREVAAAVSELETLRAANADLRGHVQRLTKRCGELMSDLQDRDRVLLSAIDDSKKARSDAADRDQRIINLSDTLATTNEALHSERARKEELARALELTTAQVEELTRARNNAVAKAEELGRARNAAMRRVAEQAALFQTRVREVQAAERDAKKKLIADFDTLEAEFARIKAEREALTSQLNATREEVTALQTALHDERASHALNTENTAEALAEAHARVARAEHEYTALRARFTLFVQRATETLRTDVQELAQSIDEIQAGRAWQVKRAIGRLRKP